MDKVYGPKQRTGTECKRTDCERHKDYVDWKLGTSSLNFCMECKHAHVSQYKRKVPNAKAHAGGIPAWRKKMTHIEIINRMKSVIPAELWKKYSHLSFAEMAEIPELKEWAKELHQAETYWFEAEAA